MEGRLSESIWQHDTKGTTLVGHFQKRFIKRPNSRSVTEMDLLSDHCPAKHLDRHYSGFGISARVHRNLCLFYKIPSPAKWGEKREESDAFFSCCVRVRGLRCVIFFLSQGSWQDHRALLYK